MIENLPFRGDEKRDCCESSSSEKIVLDNNGIPTSSCVVNEVTGFYLVCVNGVYVPGSIEQLQVFLKSSESCSIWNRLETKLRHLAKLAEC